MITLLSMWCLVAKSCLILATLWTRAPQVPPSTWLSRQEYWSGLPFPFSRGSSWPRKCLLHCRQIPYWLSYQGSPYCQYKPDAAHYVKYARTVNTQRLIYTLLQFWINNTPLGKHPPKYECPSICLLMTQETWVRSLGQEDSWSRKWQPIPIFLPGKFHGQRSLADYSPWSHKGSDTTEWLSIHTSPNYIISTNKVQFLSLTPNSVRGGVLVMNI